MTMAVEKLKKNDTIDCSRLLSTTLSLLNSPYLTYSQRGEGLESIWAQERTGAHEGDTRERMNMRVSLMRPILSLAHYFQVPAMQPILNNNK